MRSQVRDFMGAKLALFVGDRLIVIQRDDAPGLLWPGHWDMPGGGRENDETPVQCALRETEEELCLRVPESHIAWARCYTNSIGRSVWFLVGWMPTHARSEIRLGDEGQRFGFMSVVEYLETPAGIPQFQSRLIDYTNGARSEIASLG